MVDIDLFKDEGEDKDWESSPEGSDDFGDELKDDLDLGEDFQDSSALEPEGILDDEEAIPDFEEPDESEDYDDYEYGEVKDKKTSPILYVILGVVIVFAAAYFLGLIPGFKPPGKTITSRPVDTIRKPPSLVVEDTTRIETTTQLPPDQESSADQRTTPLKMTKSGERHAVLVNSCQSILNNLTQNGQFGTLMIDGNRFSVQYVSETPGMSQAMSEKIKGLLGATNIKVSSEDSQRSQGKRVYFGVVSGELPVGAMSAAGAGKTNFLSLDQFNNQIKSIANQYGLSILKIDKLAAHNGGRQQAVQIKIEGSKNQALTFLSSLNTIQSKFEIDKLLLVPAEYTDYNASRLKVVLDILVHLDKQL